MNAEELERFDIEGAGPASVFKPFAAYDPDGDCIEFFATNENFYRKRLDNLVTAYYSMKNNEVVGAFIKDVSGILKEAQKRAPGFKIEIEGRRLELVWVFTACLWGPDRDPNSMEVTIYRKLRQVAADNRVEVEGDLALV